MKKQKLDKLKKEFIGKEWPVWWDTNDGREAGNHIAMIIDVLPYNGPYDFIECIFKLTANTRSGYTEMSIEKTQLRHWRNNE